MNLYLVVSELLFEVVCEDASVNACHEEPYRISELVVARNRSQATYLAWKDSAACRWTSNIRDKPKFRTEIKRTDVLGAPRIVSDEIPDEDPAWLFRREVIYDIPN